VLKVKVTLTNEGQAVLRSGEIEKLDDCLGFLLKVLHLEGYSYVHNLLAIKGSADIISATGERYEIKQIWNTKASSSILVSTERLVHLENEIKSLREENEQYKSIRNSLVKEVNAFFVKEGQSPRYEEI
jgi:hypothetical protein